MSMYFLYTKCLINCLNELWVLVSLFFGCGDCLYEIMGFILVFNMLWHVVLMWINYQSIWASIKDIAIFFWILKLSGTNLSQLQHMIFNKL